MTHVLLSNQEINHDLQSMSLALSSEGHLYFYTGKDSDDVVTISLAEHLYRLFPASSLDSIHYTMEMGVLRLGLTAFKEPLPSSFLFWQSLGHLYIQIARSILAPQDYKIDGEFRVPFPRDDLIEILENAPFMTGSQHLNLDTLEELWERFTLALHEELLDHNGNLQAYLETFNVNWTKVGRVCFHMAENKANPTRPFAFLATYTTRVSATSALQHLPLERALKEYEGEYQRHHLLSLLVPVQKAAESNPFIKTLVDGGAIFHPQSWGVKEAHQFLKAIPVIEEAGVMVRVPNWWTPKSPPRPQVQVAIGNASTGAVSVPSLLDFNIAYSLPDGESLTYEELQELMDSQENLVQVKGQWVEVDSDKIKQVLDHWQTIERQVRKNGLSFSEGMRLLVGVQGQKDVDLLPEEIVQWSAIKEGNWLQETLQQLRHPEGKEAFSTDTSSTAILKKHLRATLRPYQEQGVRWLWWLYTLKLGGCLADDMGLGKTIQVLSLLLCSKYTTSSSQITHSKRPHLLVLPASLLGNWQNEISKFAPGLKIVILHSSHMNLDQFKNDVLPDFGQADVVITTYGNVYRFPWMSKISWDIVILDEAQSIKNPTTKQTTAIKALKAQVRFVLTGTPVENRLLDLWSLFDFVAPGLLGTSKAFSTLGKKTIEKHQDGSGEGRFYKAVRHLVSPYILRRLKSDKRIISDLPDKTELDVYCHMSKQQIALYQKSIKELQQHLEAETEGIKRRGLILTYLNRFKQICNHPSQWLGYGDYQHQASGKFLRLKELCESISARQEKVLVFTQFKEIIPALHDLLESVFERSGLILHGQTAVKNRAKLVEEFQQEQGPPFFILSIRAGGTGLNLTSASHVIHFDRWWNPAVENQATDRAYRIGQKRNVLVHKFICQGTIEEKIDDLIRQKKNLSADILEKSDEVSLTEMDNDSLLKMISLDIHRALGE